MAGSQHFRVVPDELAFAEVAAFLAEPKSPTCPSDVADALRLPPNQVERVFEKFADFDDGIEGSRGWRR